MSTLLLINNYVLLQILFKRPDGNPLTTTTAKPKAAGAGGANLGSLAALAGGGGSGGGLGALLKNPQILAALSGGGGGSGGLAALAGAGGGSGGGLGALLKNPQILASLVSARTPATPSLGSVTIPLSTLLKNPKILSLLKDAANDNTAPASPSIPGGLSSIPGFAELAQSFPGGPAELQRVLNQPQVLDFISKNPDVIKKFLGDGLPSPDKLQALLALAAPPQEGVEQGIFGPDPFAGKFICGYI